MREMYEVIWIVMKLICVEKDERMEIVEGLREEVNLRIESEEEAKELESLIGNVGGLTGADLVALLSSAQLTAVSLTLSN